MNRASIKMENDFLKKKEFEIEYILSNEDIKFPTFFDMGYVKYSKLKK